jgi:BASS family bile acid:Na+ symporter
VELLQLSMLAIKVSVLTLVFALGLNATTAEATYAFRHPRRLLRGFLALAVVVPVVAAAFALVADLPRPVAIAIVAMSISPVPPILPMAQLKGGARPEYAYGVLVAAALLSVIVVPVAVIVLGALFGMDARFPPAAIAKIVGLSVLAPVALGIAVRHFWADGAERLGPWLRKAATVVLAVALLPILARAWPAMRGLMSTGMSMAVVLAVVVIAIATGHLLGGPNREDRVALAIASAMRHPGVALALARTNAPDEPLVPAAVLTYFLTALVLTSAYSAVRKRLTAGEAAA